MSSVEGKRIELWVEHRDGAPAVNVTMRALLDELGSDGASVAVIVPERVVTGPADGRVGPGADLVLLKTATSLGLSVALAAERRGQIFLNTARSSWQASDKAVVVARLAAAGLPVPATFVATAGDHLAKTPADIAGGWVSKPVRGVHGRGVLLHDEFPTRTPSDPPPASFVVDDGTRLIQRLVGRDQDDLKVYVAGGVCFAGRKRFGIDSFKTDDIEPVELSPDVAEVVLAAGRLLGLRCFGVDLRTGDGEPVIIDVNPFPGYRGFPEAVDALRADIDDVLLRRRP